MSSEKPVLPGRPVGILGGGQLGRMFAIAARRMGYTALRLETGDRQPEAIRLYEGAGYRRTEAFGPYVGIPHSVCFDKRMP